MLRSILCFIFLLPTLSAEQVPPDPLASLPPNATEALAQADRVVVYKKSGKRELALHLFFPPGHQTDGPARPGALFIHGGGWGGGAPAVHGYEALLLARRGMVTASISYRLLGQENGAESPADCLADAKSALRYLREHAPKLGLDPTRLAVGGGSAGAHLAAALATIPGYDDPDDRLETPVHPDALLLLYPAFDLIKGWKSGAAHCRRAQIDPASFSPATLAGKDFPPTLILVGADDPVSPPASNSAFFERMKTLGRPVEILTFAGKNHTLFSRQLDDPHFRSYLIHSQRFFQELGWLPEIPLPELPKLEFTRLRTP
ncbi:MAG: alpha/beta hydrolase [Verrucomicrobiales bacterium]